LDRIRDFDQMRSNSRSGAFNRGNSFWGPRSFSGLLIYQFSIGLMCYVLLQDVQSVELQFVFTGTINSDTAVPNSHLLPMKNPNNEVDYRLKMTVSLYRFKQPSAYPRMKKKTIAVFSLTVIYYQCPGILLTFCISK